MLKDAVTSTFDDIAARIPINMPEVSEFDTRIKSFLKSPSQTMLIPVLMGLINTSENIRDTDENETEFQSLKESIKKLEI